MAPRPIFLWGLGGAGLLALIAVALNKKDAIVTSFTSLTAGISTAAFKATLPSRSEPYAQMLLDAADNNDVSPFLLWALLERESRSGEALTPPGPAGTGDWAPRSGKMPPDGKGWGRGLMQLDWNSIAQQVDWADPKANIEAGAAHFASMLRFFALVHGNKGMSIRWAKNGKYYQIGGPNADYADPRPLSGNALTAAALAAYNTGQGNVLVSVAMGLDPDTTTAPGPTKSPDYSSDVLRRAEELLASYTAATPSGVVTASTPAAAPAVADLSLDDLLNDPLPGGQS